MQIVIQHSLSACFVMEGARLCLKKMAANTSPAIASTSSMTIHSGTTTNTAVADVPLPSLSFSGTTTNTAVADVPLPSLSFIPDWGKAGGVWSRAEVQRLFEGAVYSRAPFINLVGRCAYAVSTYYNVL